MSPKARSLALRQKTQQACDQALGHAQTLGDELSKPADQRESEVMEIAFSALSRLRGDLVKLVDDYTKFIKSNDYKSLNLTERRGFQDANLFGTDPKRMLELWNRIINAARLCADHQPCPLYDAPLAEGSPAAQRIAALDNLMVKLHEFVNARDQQSDESEQMGFFKDIPLPASVFCAHLHAAYRICLAQRRDTPIRFLDVGCGGGTKVLLASEFFGRTDGLEFDPKYVAAAQTLMATISGDNCDIFQGDALCFEDYAAYDVIYFYQPIRNPKLLIELEQRICSESRPGTVIIAPYQGFMGRYSDYNCGHVAGNVWLAHASQDFADRTRQRAESLGAVLIPQPMEWESHAGVLQPLSTALRNNGFHVKARQS